MNSSLGLSLEFETVLLSVSVSVSFMRPRSNKSWSRSRWQDQSVKSPGLGLVYKTHIYGLQSRSWSRFQILVSPISVLDQFVSGLSMFDFAMINSGNHAQICACFQYTSASFFRKILVI